MGSLRKLIFNVITWEYQDFLRPHFIFLYLDLWRLERKNSIKWGCSNEWHTAFCSHCNGVNLKRWCGKIYHKMRKWCAESVDICICWVLGYCSIVMPPDATDEINRLWRCVVCRKLSTRSADFVHSVKFGIWLVTLCGTGRQDIKWPHAEGLVFWSYISGNCELV